MKPATAEFACAQSEGAAPRSSRASLSSFEIPIRALLAAGSLALALTVGAVASQLALVVASLILLAYLAAELMSLRRSVAPGTPWLVSPISIASFYTFGLTFVATNVVFWTPGYLDRLAAARWPGFEWLTWGVLYGIVAATAMWTGFRFHWGTSVGFALWRSPLLARMLRQSYEVRWSVFWICIVLSVLCRVLQVRLGFYGVLGDAEGGEQFRQYLNYGANLGIVALIGVAANVFSQREASPALRLLLGIVLAHECIWGALGADKADTVMPVVLVGIVYYMLRGRVPVRYVGVAVLLLAASFLVLMPLRQLARTGGTLDNRSIASIASAAYVTAGIELSAGTPAEDTGGGLGTTVLSRLNATLTTAIALRYAELHPEDPVPRQFLTDTILAPVYTLIPRVVWPSKPNGQSVSYWFYRTVMEGGSQTTKAGTTMVGYLNFIGGLFAVIVGFAFIGVAQKVIHVRFLSHSGGGSLLVLLSMLSVVGEIAAQYGALLSQPFRILPLVLIIQALLFRR